MNHQNSRGAAAAFGAKKERKKVRNMKKALLSLGLSLALVLSLLIVPAGAAADPGAGRNLDGLYYQATCLDGETITSESMKGKNVVMIFYQDDESCSNSNATFQDCAAASWIGTGDVEVVAIPIVTGTKASVTAYKEKYAPDSKIHFCYFDIGTGNYMLWDYIDAFGMDRSNVYTPVTVFMDSGNKLQYCTLSYLTESKMRSYVAKLSSLVQADPVTNLGITGRFDYGAAAEVLTLMNQQRKENGLSALTMDTQLNAAAMQRAAETAVYWSHTRPNGEDCFSVTTGLGGTAAGENIAAGQTTAADVMTGWMDSKGHRENILSTDFTSIGVGCFYHAGRFFWVQTFSNKTADGVVPSGVKTAAATVETLLKNIVPVSLTAERTSIGTHDSSALKLTVRNQGWTNATAEVSYPAAQYASSNSAVATVSGGRVIGVSAGTAVITAAVPGAAASVSCTVTVVDSPAAPASVVTAGIGTDSVRVAWKAVAGAEGYMVYRAAGASGPYTLLRSVDSSTLYFNSKSLTAGQTYYYKVQAYKTVNGSRIYGALSAAASGRPVPAAPSVTAVSNTSCVVRFPALERRMGIEIFYFTRKDPAHNYDGVKAAHIERAGVTGLTVGGLAKGRSYWFMLRAYYRNGAGTKYYSGYTRLSPEYISWKTPSMAGLAAAAGGTGKVRLAWTASSGMSGYEAFVKDGTRLRSAGTLPGSASYADVGGLVSGRTYVFTARAWQTVNGRKIYSACAPYVSAKAG